MRIRDWSSDVCSSDLLSVRSSLRQASLPTTRRSRVVSSPAVQGAALSAFSRTAQAPSRSIRPSSTMAARPEIGRASCRERVWQHVENTGVAVSLKKNKVFTQYKTEDLHTTSKTQRLKRIHKYTTR